MAATITDRFARLKALQKPRTAFSSLPEPALEFVEQESFSPVPDRAAASERLAIILGATVKLNRYGEHLSLHCWHGGHAPCVPDASGMRLLAPDAPEDIADVRQWLFLDTETTGLTGGTGTYPFLVGLAWWEGGGLEVEQLFMREHSEERSVLTALAERLAERPVLVTFNGKSFDWPLLETRYRMTRTAPPALRAHLDFLHPARNLWRLRLGSVRLSELERHVLGWDRGADLVSQFIPKIYLDFVRRGHADPLLPVFQHNQMDLRGLAGLAGRVLDLLSEVDKPVEDGLELYGVSRICERRGEVKRARKLYEQSLVSVLPAETDRAARTALARLAKRDGDLTRARELWEGARGNSREGYEAYEQLAIYYEHDAREPRHALAVAREALAQLHEANRCGTIAASIYRKNHSRFQHRLSRLERKVGRPLLDMLDA